MLAKPMQAYGQQAADLEQGLIQRKNVIGDWVAQRTNEFQQAKDQAIQKYNEIANQIQTDLRFNDRQRTDAVKQASAALQTHLAQIDAQNISYQQTAQQYNANILAQIAQLRLYQNPQANTTDIQNTLLSSIGGSGQQGIDIYGTKKKTLTG
jgi:hypothetical protein